MTDPRDNTRNALPLAAIHPAVSVTAALTLDGLFVVALGVDAPDALARAAVVLAGAEDPAEGPAEGLITVTLTGEPAALARMVRAALAYTGPLDGFGLALDN